ncbi:MAG: hypothetical protein P1U42_07360 [Phycisphaerales bacterium]|nr:hypothetical protein [Phycisphaerales bacterium]
MTSQRTKQNRRKPTIRVIRNLARSGGTLIGKCLGCMDHVTMISEFHPSDLNTTQPMKQAHEWFGLVDNKDIQRWKVRPPTAFQFVSICETRANARGDSLLIRDWSHLDYIGVPFTKPQFGFALADILDGAYELKTATTVRHPIDQYLSLLQIPFVSSKLSFDCYIHGCFKFAQFANEHGFYRYEDFTSNPDSVLQSLCEDLDLEYDGSYKQKWFSYTKITGDTQQAIGRGATKKTIESFDRKPIADDVIAKFRANSEYQQACELLGYAP